MEELIKITEHNGNKVVSARELYRFLEATERFSHWSQRMFQYGFIENVDYSGCKVFNALANQHLQDYALTIDCAKEISMLQRSEKGKQARQYFIECERVAMKVLDPSSLSKLEILKMAIESEEQRVKLESENKEISMKLVYTQKELTEAKPKALFADAVSASHTSILVGELAKLICQNGVQIGQNRLFEQLRSEGFLISRKGTDYNMPTQKSMELELFEIKETTITHPDGHTSINKTPKVTGKGQIYFVNRFVRKAS